MSIKQRQVHLDFHTSEHIPNIGIDFKKEEFAEQLKKLMLILLRVLLDVIMVGYIILLKTSRINSSRIKK